MTVEVPGKMGVGSTRGSVFEKMVLVAEQVREKGLRERALS